MPFQSLYHDTFGDSSQSFPPNRSDFVAMRIFLLAISIHSEWKEPKVIFLWLNNIFRLGFEKTNIDQFITDDAWWKLICLSSLFPLCSYFFICSVIRIWNSKSQCVVYRLHCDINIKRQKFVLILRAIGISIMFLFANNGIKKWFFP